MILKHTFVVSVAAILLIQAKSSRLLKRLRLRLQPNPTEPSDGPKSRVGRQLIETFWPQLGHRGRWGLERNSRC